MSLTKVSFSMINGAAVNPIDYGAVGDGVTDDTAVTFGTVVAGGGVNAVPVYYNGTNWIIG